MAHAAGTSARAHRLIGLVAALLLATATALAFGRVFLGTATTMKLLAAAAAAACLAAALERRSLLLSTLSSAIGLALALGLIVFPGTTWYGLPTADTFRAALDAAALVGEQARIQAAPAEPIPPLLLAAVVSLWAAVFSAHALAFRAGSPLLGLVPPVALVAFADTVLEEFVKPLYGVAFLAAALLVVFADGLARVQGWGPVWSSARRGVAWSAGRGARRLALTALGAAIVAPIVVPGFGSRALIDFGTAVNDRVAIDPFVSVRSSLNQRRPVPVLRVLAPRATYIRLVSLPEFDGVTWGPADPQGAEQIAPGDPVPTSEGRGGLTDRVDIEVTADLAQRWLPTPYPVSTIDVPGRTVVFDPASGTTFLDAPLEAGDTYTVTTPLTQPTDDELRAAPAAPPLEGGRYLMLPDAWPEEIADLARRWTADAETDYDRAIAIQERLRNSSEFIYQVDTPLGGGTSSILEFLTVRKAGFCQQFSTAMAAMLRSLDVQARVVVGFASGNSRTPGQYTISTLQAHSWVEVYFPTWGWMPFEPTPGRLNPVTEAYDDTFVPACPGPDCPDGTGGTPSGAGAQAGPGASQRDRIDQDPRIGTAPPPLPLGPQVFPGRGGPPIRARTLALIAAIGGALFLLLVPPVRAIRRKIRLRGAAAEPRRLILVTYEQFTERAAGLGLGRGPGETPDEYRRKVVGTGYLSDGQLDGLTRLTNAAAYSQHEPGGEAAEQAGLAAGSAIRELRRAVGPTRWLVGLYRRS